MISYLEFIKKRPLFILVLLHLFTRLTNLTLLPIFSDEALYLDWGWQTLHIPGKLWHPLTDAKQPFLIWLFGIGSAIFPDPLFGARLVSVFTGLLSLLGLYRIGKEFFSEKVSISISILYLVTPIFLFYDRQALMESAVTASAIWSLFFLLKLLESQKTKFALLLGVSLGLGFFVKNSVAIFLLTALIIVWMKIINNKKLFVSLSLSQISILFIFLGVNLPLFFQDLYWSTLPTNSRWTFTASELLKFPIKQWSENLLGNTQITFLFLTPLIFFFALIGIHSTLKAKSYQLKAVLLWFLISISLYLLSLKFMNFMSMRYITPFLPPLLIFAAIYLSKHLKLFVLSLSLSLSLSLLLIFNPIGFFRLDSKINKYSYIKGYLTGFDTGYQLNEIVKYFNQQSQNGPINVTTAVHTFNPESGTWVYMQKNPNVAMAYLDSRLYTDLSGLDCLTADRPTYFLAKLNDTAGMEKYFDKVTVITNPYNSDYATIYKLKQNCTGESARLNLTR